MNDEQQKPVTSLPFGIRLARVEFDLATLAILSVVTARNRMQAFLAMVYDRHVPGGNLLPTDTELTLLFNDAWIIVDRLDMLRRLLMPQLALAPSGTNVSEFRGELASIRAVRNRMDHVDAKMIARKTRAPDFPILGVITATITDANQLAAGTLTHIDHIVLTHSDFHAKINLNSAPQAPFPIKLPVDHIRLHAFEKVIDLSRVVSLAEEITNVLESREKNPPNPETRLSIVIRQTFDAPLVMSKHEGSSGV